MFVTSPTWSRAQEGKSRRGITIDAMSDHTERLRKLRDRMVAAKEFL
jgi:hypothetical protein